MYEIFPWMRPPSAAEIEEAKRETKGIGKYPGV
jgi:hypothetical protein